MRPQVSVVMAVKNEERHIREAICSILAQRGVEFELIVVDDGSDDSTIEIATEIATSDKRLRVLRNPGAGKVSAFNRGVSEARGAWTCLFAGDDVMPAGSLDARWCKVKDIRSSRPVVGLCRLVTMSDNPAHDEHEIPRSPSKGAYSGVCYLMDRAAVALMFPVPENLPNEDTWLEVAAQSLDLEVVHTPVLGCKWRLYEGNSINFLLGFAEFNDRLTRRMVAFQQFLDLHGPRLSREAQRKLEARARCEAMRRQGSIVGIIRSGVSAIEMLRAIALSGPKLYAVRKRFYGVFSGW